MPITAIRGFNDILPEDSPLLRHIENAACRVFSSYGFSEIKVPVVEKTELFARSIGQTTDIVEKEMYTFSDRHGESLTLRPEGTASVVRAYIEHKMYVNPAARLFYTGPMFRYERPQKGRYRQFYQIGAEVLGDDSPRVDAEVIGMLLKFFDDLDVKGVELQINSLGCPECRPAYKEKLLNFLSGVKDNLCENCVRRIDENPLRALDCKSPKCIEATRKAPSIIDFLCPGCKSHFEEVGKFLALDKIKAAVNPRMVRGLDYYTRTAFEITAFRELGSQNAVAAGGRYDNLVEELGGPKTPCFGFAIGVERVALLIKHSSMGLRKPLTVFIALGTEAEGKKIELVKGLRDRGVSIIEDFSTGSLKSRMKRADRSGARFAAILGTDEMKEGVVTLKDMKTSAQEKVPWGELAGRLSSQSEGGS